ncbi:M48 family metallopeptidase, partial [Escherichia coli]|nr:M48 family metallopeptidase [Escherichia coli]
MTGETPSVAVLPGHPRIEVHLRRSGRARRYSLRVSQLDGRVTLTLPARASLREGLDFLNERAEWVRGHLEQRPEALCAGLGGVVPFEGMQLPVRGAATLRAPRIEDGALWVPDDATRAPARIQAFLKQAARDRLVEACDRYSAALGRRYGRITLRDTRSRWGSCTAQGDLMFSWRLIMAPAPVLDYV